MHSLQLDPDETTLEAPSIDRVAWPTPWYHGDDVEAHAMFGKIRSTEEESNSGTFGQRSAPNKRNDFAAPCNNVALAVTAAALQGERAVAL